MPTFDVYYRNPAYARAAGHPRLGAITAPTPEEAEHAFAVHDPHGAGIWAVRRGSPNPHAQPDGTLDTLDPAGDIDAQE